MDLFTATMPEKKLAHIVRSEQQLSRMAEVLNRASEIGFDTETTHLQYRKLELAILSIYIDKTHKYAIPFNFRIPHTYLHISQVVKKLKSFFEKSKVIKHAHNLAFDIMVLSKYGVNTNLDYCECSLNGDYFLDENKRHGLKLLTKEILNRELSEFKNLVKIDKKTGYNDILEQDYRIMSEYAINDAWAHKELGKIFVKQLKAENLYKQYRDVGVNYCPVLIEMRKAGINVNLDKLKSKAAQVKGEIIEVTNDIYDAAGIKFNINSGPELGSVLFKKLGLPVWSYTKKSNAPKTDEKALTKLKKLHKVIPLILNYKSLAKLNSTYLEGLIPKVEGDKIYPDYLGTHVVTFRLSSKNPNFQNMPRAKDTIGFREVFLPEGNWLIDPDYGQLELRLQAHYSNDPVMVEGFKSGKDFHQYTADQLEVERFTAKTINFGVTYLMGVKALSEKLGITKTKAAEFMEQYFKTFVGLKKQIQKNRVQIMRKGFIENFAGLRRRLWADLEKADSNYRFEEIVRQGNNFPSQSGAAYIVRLAQIKLLKEVKEFQQRAQIHDEILGENKVSTTKKSAVELSKEVKNVMENIVKLSVPLVVDPAVGKNWLEAH